jgi:pyrimidine operon attenuation protein/uracil phosphoribosyltransferase
MTLRITSGEIVIAALLWTGISSLSGFVLSRYLIDIELTRTDMAVRRTAENLDRFEIAMAQQVLNTTRSLKERIDALGLGKGHPR